MMAKYASEARYGLSDRFSRKRRRYIINNNKACKLENPLCVKPRNRAGTSMCN